MTQNFQSRHLRVSISSFYSYAKYQVEKSKKVEKCFDRTEINNITRIKMSEI